jgi:glycerophosphoryl diester phosphodiesterase
VDDARAAGLFVHAWTLRNDAEFLSPSYDGDPRREVEQFLDLGVDGVFTDFPNTVVDVIRARRGTGGREMAEKKEE